MFKGVFLVEQNPCNQNQIDVLYYQTETTPCLKRGMKMREHKAVAYIRVSTQGQLEKWGMDAQKDAILEYAKNNNLFTEFCPKMVANAVDIVEEIRQSFII